MSDDSRTGPVRPRPSSPDPRTPSNVQRAVPIYYALLFAILTVFGLYLMLQLKHVLLLLFISLLFAAAMARPAALLERFRIPEAISVVLIYLFALGVVIAVGYYVLPPLFGQVARLGQNLPEYADRYEQLRQTYDQLQSEYPSLPPFDEQVASLGARVISSIGQRLTALPSQLFGLFLDVLSVFVISMLLVTSRHRILALILALVHPEHRPQTADVLRKMWERIGYYLRAKMIVMVIVGAITYVAILLIGVPFALLLSIVVAFGEVIPRAGPWLARIPLFGIAALEGWETLVLTIIASVVIENGKGYVISPLVEGNQLDIHPLLVFISVLIGSALLGFAGAFVAVPAAAMVQVLFEEVIYPWRTGQFDDENAMAIESEVNTKPQEIGGA